MARHAALAEQTVEPDGLARLLIAEDHPVNQQVVRSQVEKLGYHSDVVSNGREAVEALTRQAYALVLMDCQMPVLDGLAATHAIRNLAGAARHTPIIALTANAMRGERERCLAAGMNDYLSKPFKQQDLANIISCWLQPQQVPVISAPAEHKPVFEERVTKAAGSAESPLQARLAELRREGGAELVAKFIEIFLSDTEKRLSTLALLVEQGEIKMLEAEAHALKGACGNLGALHMMKLALALEEQAETGTVRNAAALLAQLELEFLRLKPLFEVERQV